MQRPRDRCGTQREHIDFQPQMLESLFDLNTEPLLLVDDQQTEILETDVL